MRETPLSFDQKLLIWYDSHHRDLPWRVSPENIALGMRPDPYRVWLSEIMLQQTQVASVIAYFQKFVDLWPDIGALAAADDAEVMSAWAGLGYYSRARNLIACARKVANERDGAFPQTAKELMALSGIGPYTAAAIAAIAYDLPETVVDGNVERVISRLEMIEEPLPESKKKLWALAAERTPDSRPGDYAQAMMDLGATICKPGKPDCGACPVRDCCKGHKAGVASSLPRRMRRAAKPVRFGYVWVAQRSDGSVLAVQRPARGLLGGMLALPSSDWAEEKPVNNPPFDGDWQRVPGTVRHTFTHFHLELQILKCSLQDADAAGVPGFVPGAKFDPIAMPTVFRKVWNIATA